MHRVACYYEGEGLDKDNSVEVEGLCVCVAS